MTEDPERLSQLATDPATSPEVLHQLATSTLPFVREAVALHSRVTAATLLALAPSRLDSEPDLRVAKAIARNPAAPEAVLLKVGGALREDQVSGERRELEGYQQLALLIVEHMHAPVEVVTRLLAWLPTGARTQCAHSARRPEVLALLAADRSATVREAVGKTAQPE